MRRNEICGDGRDGQGTTWTSSADSGWRMRQAVSRWGQTSSRDEGDGGRGVVQREGNTAGSAGADRLHWESLYTYSSARQRPAVNDRPFLIGTPRPSLSARTVCPLPRAARPAFSATVCLVGRVIVRLCSANSHPHASRPGHLALPPRLGSTRLEVTSLCFDPPSIKFRLCSHGMSPLVVIAFYSIRTCCVPSW